MKATHLIMLAAGLWLAAPLAAHAQVVVYSPPVVAPPVVAPVPVTSYRVAAPTVVARPPVVVSPVTSYRPMTSFRLLVPAPGLPVPVTSYSIPVAPTPVAPTPVAAYSVPIRRPRLLPPRSWWGVRRWWAGMWQGSLAYTSRVSRSATRFAPSRRRLCLKTRRPSP